MTIGIIGAMPEEVEAILASIKNVSIDVRGSREYHCGTLEGQNVVVVLSRVGKVAAASTATTLINHFAAKSIIFTGVAGGVAPHIRIGDVVIATSLIQHDLDASAIMRFKKFEIPLLGVTEIQTDSVLRGRARRACERFVAGDPRHRGAKVYEGIIASGDQFIFDKRKSESLCSEIPGLLAVEMEGAAVAQVCYEWKVPFVIVRSISDNADHNSIVDFPRFVQEVAAPLSAGVVKSLLIEEV